MDFIFIKIAKSVYICMFDFLTTVNVLNQITTTTTTERRIIVRLADINGRRQMI